MLDKQILREYGLYADLFLPGGSKEIQPYQLGLATDTKQLIHRIGATYYHNLNTTESTPTAGSLCVIGAGGYNVILGGEVGTYDHVAGTLTFATTIIGTESSFWPDDKYAYFGNTIADPEGQIGYDELVSDALLIQSNAADLMVRADIGGDITLQTDSGSIVLDTTRSGYNISLNPSQKEVDTTISTPDKQYMVAVNAATSRVGFGTDAPVTLVEMFDDTAPGGSVVNALTLTRDSGAVGTNGDGVGVSARLRNAAGGGSVVSVGGISWAWNVVGTGDSICAISNSDKTLISAYTSPGGDFVDVDAWHDVITSGGYSRSSITGHYDSADARAILVLSGSRGTEASPSALQSGDVIGGVYVKGYHGGGYYDTDRPVIAVDATENWTNAARGFGVTIYTREDGSNGAPTARVRVTDDGLVAIGHDDPDTILDIRESKASSTTVLLHVNTATANTNNNVNFRHTVLNNADEETISFEVYSSLETIIDGSEDSLVRFHGIMAGTYREWLRFSADNREVVVNEDGVQMGFRVEGGSNPNLLVTDPTNDRIAIGHSDPDSILDIKESQASSSTRLLHTNSATAATDNYVNLRHQVLNDAGEEVVSFQIYSSLEVISDGSEDSLIDFRGVMAGVSRTWLTFTGDNREVVVNEDSLQIGFRVEGGSNPNLLVTDPANNRIGIGHGGPAFIVDIREEEIEDNTALQHVNTATAHVDNGVRFIHGLNSGADVKFDAFQIVTTLSDVGGGTEDSLVQFLGAINGAGVEFITLNDSGVVVNEDGVSSVAFRVEGDSNPNLLVTDPVNDRAAVGTASPDCRFEVFDTTTSSGAVVPVAKLTRDDGGNYADGDGLSIQFELPDSGGTERVLGEHNFEWGSGGSLGAYSNYSLRLMDGGSAYNALKYYTYPSTSRLLSIPADQIDVGRGGPLSGAISDPYIFRISVGHGSNDYNWKNMLTLRTTTTNVSNGDVGLGGGIAWALEDEYASTYYAGRIICEWGPTTTGESFLRFYAFDGGEVEYARIGYGDHALQAGDPSGTDFVQIDNAGVMTFEGDAEFHPARVSQNSQPTPSVGELLVWHDADDNQVWLVYNDADEGVKKVEMT